MKITVNDTEYTAVRRKDIPCDNYYSRGLIVDKVRFPFLYTHIAYIDDYKTGVKSKGLIVGIIVTFIATVSLAIAIVMSLGNVKSDKNEYNTEIDTGIIEERKENPLSFSGDTVLIRYNKYLLYKNGKIDLKFINGENKATLEITGDDIEFKTL